jgi:hypothetical protein
MDIVSSLLCARRRQHAHLVLPDTAALEILTRKLLLRQPSLPQARNNVLKMR